MPYESSDETISENHRREVQKQLEKVIALLEREVRSTDQNFSFFAIGTGIISACYSFLCFWIVATFMWSGIFSRILLFLPPYLLLFLVFPLFLYVRRRREFFELLELIHLEAPLTGHKPQMIKDLRHYASRIRTYWDMTILGLFVYLISIALILCAYWTLYI